MSYISLKLKNIIAVAKKATNSMNRDFSEIEKLLSSIKDYSNFINSAFEKVEKNLRFELEKIEPGCLISKEWVPNAKGPYYLISYDGLDNFAHGMPLFSVSITACDASGNPLASVIYNPAMDELYFAEKGQGAYKEGFRSQERLRVSSRKDFKGSCVSTSKIYDEGLSNIRRFGSISLELAYLAAGKLDLVISEKNKSSAVVAGILLVKEAGGYVYDIEQKDIRSENIIDVIRSGDVFAVNNSLGKKVFDLINS